MASNQEVGQAGNDAAKALLDAIAKQTGTILNGQLNNGTKAEKLLDLARAYRAVVGGPQ